MKHRLAGIVFFASIAWTNASLGIADLGMDINYLGISIKSSDSSGTENNSDASGYLYTLYLHASFQATSLFNIALGPYAAVGVGSPKNLAPGYTFDRGSIFRFGIDLMVTAQFVPILSPFIRAMAGAEFIDNWQSFSLNSNQYQTRAALDGLSYNVMGGLLYPLGGNLCVYAQAGFAGTAKRSVKPVSGTMNGVPFNLSLSGDPQVSYTGLIIGGGIILRF